MTTYKITMSVEVDLEADVKEAGIDRTEQMISHLLCDALAEFNKSRGTTPGQDLRRAAKEYAYRTDRNETCFSTDEWHEVLDAIMERALTAEQLRNAVALGNKVKVEILPEDRCESCDLPLDKNGLCKRCDF